MGRPASARFLKRPLAAFVLLVATACTPKTAQPPAASATPKIETPLVAGTWKITATATSLQNFSDDTVGSVTTSTWTIESTCSLHSCDFAQFASGKSENARLYRYGGNNRWTYSETGKADCRTRTGVSKNAYAQDLRIELSVTKSERVAGVLRATELRGTAVQTDTPVKGADKVCTVGRAEHALQGTRTG